MKKHYLPLADLRLAVAVPEQQPKRRSHGRIVLLDPTDRTRNLLLEVSP